MYNHHLGFWMVYWLLLWTYNVHLKETKHTCRWTHCWYFLAFHESVQGNQFDVCLFVKLKWALWLWTCYQCSCWVFYFQSLFIKLESLCSIEKATLICTYVEDFIKPSTAKYLSLFFVRLLFEHCSIRIHSDYLVLDLFVANFTIWDYFILILVYHPWH